MNTKTKLISTVCSLAAYASTAQAVIITGLDARSNVAGDINGATTDAATGGTLTVARSHNIFGNEVGTLGALGSEVTYTFTLVDADLDGNSVFDDTMTWSITATADTGGAVSNVISGSGINNGANHTFGVTNSTTHGGDELISATETLTFAFVAGSFTLDGGSASSAVFDGFTAANLDFNHNNNVTATINGASVGTATGVKTFAATDTLEFGGTGTGRGGRWTDLKFSLSIPEPSSTALLGLGGLALILRRRK